MKILVTGAAGLIGRHLIASLDAGPDIWAVSRSPIADAGRAHVITADLTSPHFVDTLPASIDTIVHLAQSSAYRDFPERALDVFAVNVASTARLLDWGRRAGASRFILASAGGAGRDAVSPLAYYLASKRSAELLALGYQSAMQVIVLRFHFVYGAGQRPSMLVPRLIESVRSGTPITLAGTDGIRLTPTHVTDAVNAIHGSMRLDGAHTIDVGGPEVLTLKSMASIIGRKISREPKFERSTGEVPPDLIADLTEMRALLGGPQRRFELGVDDLLA